jgi:predicted polyphosphate/ATP-dependent NAD kinase
VTRRLGLLINPIAGMGGRVGLHGTDGDALAAARTRGAEPVAARRAHRTVARLRLDGVEVLTAAGPMGGKLLRGLGIEHRTVHTPADPTGPRDTRQATRALADLPVDLLLVAGGDGTIRDVAAALEGRDVTVLGIPTGVKMHSAAFATTPEAAADAASRFLADPAGTGRRDADVVDLAEDGPRLYASLRVPAVAGAMQAAKSRPGPDDGAALVELGREIAAEMRPGHLYLLGPGSTVAHVSAALGIRHSLLGVDAVLDGRLIGADLDERAILDLLDRHPRRGLVLGVVGGQGFLLGRGNQQLSPAVVTAIGAEHVVVLAAPAKIAALRPPVLRVDAGDDTAVSPLLGHHRVRTGRGHSTVLRIMA